MDQLLAESREAKSRASGIIEHHCPEVLAKPMNMPTAALSVALTTASFSLHAQSFASKSIAGEEYARQQIHAVTKNVKEKPFSSPLLPTKAIAIATVEPVLFNSFGKDNITRQQPYETYLINGLWYIYQRHLAEGQHRRHI